MEWYYAENNERRGPISEAEFNELIRTGRVTAATQVWRSGMEDWAPLGQTNVSAAGGATEATTPATATAACAECRQPFPTAEMLQYEGQWICPNCKPVFFQKVKEGIEPVRQMNYAGFWIRFLAKFVDGVIVGIPGYALQFGLGFAFQGSELAPMIAIGTWLVSFALQLTYGIWMNGKYGATLGKMACGLRIVTPSGGKITYGIAAGRFFAEIVSAIIIYIGYIMAGFDEEKRALHDRICNTRVIRHQA